MHVHEELQNKIKEKFGPEVNVLQVSPSVNLSNSPSLVKFSPSKADIS